MMTPLECGVARRRFAAATAREKREDTTTECGFVVFSRFS